MWPAQSQGTNRIFVILPVFEDRESLALLAEKLSGCIKSGLVLVVVDDGSVGSPVQQEDLKATFEQAEIIRLVRNMGHQRAIAIGLSHVVTRHFSEQNVSNSSENSVIIVMDADGEDRPENVETLLTALAQDNVDVVVAQRRWRPESVWFRLFYQFYRVIFWLLTGKTLRFGNFMALKVRSARRLAAMGELWIHLAGAVLVSRLRRMDLALDRGTRYAGRSKMNLVSLALHGFRAVTVFAEDVLVRVGVACAVASTACIVLGLTVITLKLAGLATPGWFSISLGVLVMLLLQMGALALMMLLLSGVANVAATAPPDHRRFIDRIEFVPSTVPISLMQRGTQAIVRNPN
jgi:hypothetical protein